MTAAVFPSFERISLKAIYRRNFGRRAEMIVAMQAAAELAIVRGVDEATKYEWIREAMRPFDHYAHQRGGLQ